MRKLWAGEDSSVGMKVAGGVGKSCGCNRGGKKGAGGGAQKYEQGTGVGFFTRFLVRIQDRIFSFLIIIFRRLIVPLSLRTINLQWNQERCTAST